MLFTSTLVLVEGMNSSTIASTYRDLIYMSLYNTMSFGTLDIMVMKCQNNIQAVQRVVSSFYELARIEATKANRTKVRVRVLLDGQNIELGRKQNWEVITAGKYEEDLLNEFRDLVPENSRILGLPVVIIKMGEIQNRPEPEFYDEENDSSPENPQGKPSAGEWEHDVVAVGGTFDHIHDGHKLLLTIAGFLAKEKLIVGITGSELLVHKRYAEVMESYMIRRNNVEEFISYLFPPLEIEPYMLHDVAGPTGSIEDIDALVLSQETRAGGAAVNKLRVEKNWHPLVIYEVDVIGCTTGNATNNWADKLSSTELRRLEFERLKISGTQSGARTPAET